MSLHEITTPIPPGPHRGKQLSDLPRHVIWTAVGLILLLWAAAMLSFPFGRDQGILAWTGTVILHGGMPYRDAWEVKGPAAMFPFVLVQFLFGHNMWGIRLFDLSMLLISLAAAGAITRKWWDGNAAIFAMFILAFTRSSLDFWMTAQPDAWCADLLAVAVALLCLGRPERPALRVLAAAACIAICVLQKPLYGIYLLLFLPVLTAAWTRDKRLPWKELVSIAIGFCVLIAATLAWFAARSSLQPFLDTFLVFNLTAHQHSYALSTGEQVRSFIDTMRHTLPFSVCMALALAGGVMLTRRTSTEASIFWTWLALGFLLVIMQKKYLLYHWYPAMTPLGIGTGIALSGLRDFPWTFSRRRLRVSAGTAVFLWLALIFLATPVKHIGDWLQYRTGRWPAQKYLDSFTFMNSDYFSAGIIVKVAQYLHSHTSSSDTVEVWGFDPMINYLSDRAAPSRFGYAYPLEIGAQNPFELKYRAEFMQKLIHRPPAYVAVAEKDESVLVPEPSTVTLEQFREFSRFLHGGYRLETRIGSWELWRHI